ncbi:MAG: hypothetical protein K0R66_178 [Gammaproteobacteria bacterium]|nr:hypothetical protein [Gammaproteobacteria bacterium]
MFRTNPYNPLKDPIFIAGLSIVIASAVNHLNSGANNIKDAMPSLVLAFLGLGTCAIASGYGYTSNQQAEMLRAPAEAQILQAQANRQEPQVAETGQRSQGMLEIKIPTPITDETGRLPVMTEAAIPQAPQEAQSTQAPAEVQEPQSIPEVYSVQAMAEAAIPQASQEGQSIQAPAKEQEPQSIRKTDIVPVMAEAAIPQTPAEEQLPPSMSEADSATTMAQAPMLQPQTVAPVRFVLALAHAPIKLALASPLSK